MIKFALVEDALEMHEVVVKLIENTMNSMNVEWSCRCFDSSETFISDSEIASFDILLIDIELPKMNGIELAEWVRMNTTGNSIIFLTSYVHYMKDAFGLNVHSYVLKEHMSQELPGLIKELITIKELQEFRKINFRTKFGDVQMSEEDIVCIKYENRKPVIHTQNRQIIIYGETMNSISDKLSKDTFARPNSGAIINVQYIIEISNPWLRLKHYTAKISISRGKLKPIMDAYRDYFMRGESL